MAERQCRLEADRLRGRFKLKAIHTETIDRIREETDNNPGVAFEKYKDFVKKNLIGIVGVLITIGGVITSIVLALRNGTKRAGSSTQKAGNSVQKVLSPVFGMLADGLGTMIKLTGKITSRLANHLMIFGVLILYVVFNLKNPELLRIDFWKPKKFLKNESNNASYKQKVLYRINKCILELPMWKLGGL